MLHRFVPFSAVEILLHRKYFSPGAVRLEIHSGRPVRFLIPGKVKKNFVWWRSWKLAFEINHRSAGEENKFPQWNILLFLHQNFLTHEPHRHKLLCLFIQDGAPLLKRCGIKVWKAFDDRSQAEGFDTVIYLTG